MNHPSQTSLDCIDPVSSAQYPTLTPYTGPPPVLPSAWRCTALLHPFSPLQSNSTPEDRDSPFFELCTATIQYVEGHYLAAFLRGSSGRTWYYTITPSGTMVSVNDGPPVPIDLGWSLPTTNWFGTQQPSCAGTSYLNWMQAQQVNWWKMAVPGGDPSKPAATWMWFDSTSHLPVRLMFGQGPVKGSTQGDPSQLALFQMFSFTYFSSFESLSNVVTKVPTSTGEDVVAGFSFGNPEGFELFTWNPNFGMTAFMTPVNENFNPLPTRVLYVWKPDSEYQVTSDRSQNTLMKYTYNPDNDFSSQVALLTGAAPSGVTPPPDSGSGFLINYEGDQVQSCTGGPGSPFDFGQEPPNWASIPAVQGTIQATINNNPALCPGQVATVISILFPPSPPNYPDSTYLWTWYSPLDSSGSSSRPITFMQSQSGVGVGTSLALADYFDYEPFSAPIPACNFDIPAACTSSNKPKEELGGGNGNAGESKEPKGFFAKLIDQILAFFRRLFGGK